MMIIGKYFWIILKSKWNGQKIMKCSKQDGDHMNSKIYFEPIVASSCGRHGNID
jgi:hypothetical protein